MRLKSPEIPPGNGSKNDVRWCQQGIISILNVQLNIHSFLSFSCFIKYSCWRYLFSHHAFNEKKYVDVYTFYSTDSDYKRFFQKIHDNLKFDSVPYNYQRRGCPYIFFSWQQKPNYGICVALMINEPILESMLPRLPSHKSIMRVFRTVLLRFMPHCIVRRFSTKHKLFS